MVWPYSYTYKVKKQYHKEGTVILRARHQEAVGEDVDRSERPWTEIKKLVPNK